MGKPHPRQTNIGLPLVHLADFLFCGKLSELRAIVSGLIMSLVWSVELDGAETRRKEGPGNRLRALGDAEESVEKCEGRRGRRTAKCLT
jgi:hypothetical protein